LCRSAGKAVVPIGHICRFEELMQAHKDMEAGNVSGKLVVTT
jgi:NADPH2:quinone reductase